MKNRNLLIVAIVVGAAVAGLNKWYLDERVQENAPRNLVSVYVAKSRVSPGARLSVQQLKLVRRPKAHVPPSALREDDMATFQGQELGVQLEVDDYVLSTMFGAEGQMISGNKLSDKVDGERFRAITIPVDETNSLARSVVPGDRIDLQYTVQVPGAPEKASMLFLQNIPVLATGPFAASDVDGRTGQRRFSSLTLLLPIEDALRLTFARQSGQINVLLRGAKAAASDAIDVAPIAGIKDVLTGTQRSVVESMLSRQAAVQSLTSSDAVKSQLKELLEKQRAQQAR